MLCPFPSRIRRGYRSAACSTRSRGATARRQPLTGRWGPTREHWRCTHVRPAAMTSETESPRLGPDLEQDAEQLRRIQSVTEASLAHLEIDELLDTLLDRVREILEVDTAAILLIDRSSREMVATAAKGIEEEVRSGVRIPIGQGFAGRVAAERQAVILDKVDHTNVRNPILLDIGIRSLLGVPLIADGDTIGVLHVRARGAVGGRVLRSALVRGRSRTAWRGYALAADDPAAVLTRLDDMVCHFEPDEMATVLYAVFDPERRGMTVSVAGHPLPLITSPTADAHLVDALADPPIGSAAAAPRRATEVPVIEGATIYFFTDGVVERRGEHIEVGLQRLRETAIPGPPHRGCTRIVSQVLGSAQPDDDAAVLAVHIPAPV